MNRRIAYSFIVLCLLLMTMQDVDMVMGDNNKTSSLATTFGYNKTLVPFEGVEKLLNSPFLGGGKVKL